MTATNKEKYWDGGKNIFIRHYFYSQRGLGLFNEFRYLIMFIFGIYYTLKLSHPIFLIAMFVISMPILVGIGWVSVHHISKVVDWISVEYSTYWSKYQVELQERQTKALEEMNQRGKTTSFIIDKHKSVDKRKEGAIGIDPCYCDNSTT